MARDMVDSLVPPMVERIVAQRLRESVKEQGGLIYKDMLSLRADLAHLRQGVRSPPSIKLSSCIILILSGYAQAATCTLPLIDTDIVHECGKIVSVKVQIHPKLSFAWYQA